MNIKLELHLNSVNVVLQALAELPYKHSASVIADVQRQAQEQMKPHPIPDAASTEAKSE